MAHLPQLGDCQRYHACFRSTSNSLPNLGSRSLGLRVRHLDTVFEGDSQTPRFRAVQGLNPQGERVLVIWRGKGVDNAALDEYFEKQQLNPKDREFDLIYVNGDNHIDNLRRPDETWKVRLIDEEFARLMFEVQR